MTLSYFNKAKISLGQIVVASALAGTIIGISSGLYETIRTIRSDNYKQREECAFRESFVKFDLNKNNMIDYSEYKSIIKNLPLKTLDVYVLEKMLKKAEVTICPQADLIKRQ